MAHLHLHPDRLRAHAVTAAGLADDIRAALHHAPGEDEVPAGVRRAIAELTALAAALAGVAAACEATDRAVARSFGELGAPGAV
jgi:hypothetical protein